MMTGKTIMPPSMDTHMAIDGSAVRMSDEPSARPVMAFIPMKTEAKPMRNWGPSCMMAGCSSCFFFWGGSSTLNSRAWMVCMRRGAG